MQILLIAHDYPPLESPQALRWHYLTRQLLAAGHELTVLCAALPGHPGDVRRTESGATVISVAPASLHSWAVRVGRRLRLVGSRSGGAGVSHPTSRNWRGTVNEWIKRGLGAAVFPDVRYAWLKPAERALRAWLQANRPDLVITSHEPAVSPMLWLRCRLQGVAWIADLGDPVLSAYTPRRWKRRSFALERDIHAHADALVVTNATTRDLLARRHGQNTHIEVIPQGFDATLPPQTPCQNAARPLTLLYTGRFYPFRDGRSLFEAVARTPGIVLEVATNSSASLLESYASRCPGSFRLLGELSHEQTLLAQRRSDVLVCLGNADPVQTPGKVYEYLGSQRPILYIRQAAGDPVGAWLEGELRRGWQCDSSVPAISAMLGELAARSQSRMLHAGLDLNADAAEEHSWQSRGKVLTMLCQEIVRAPGGSAEARSST